MEWVGEEVGVGKKKSQIAVFPIIACHWLSENSSSIILLLVVLNYFEGMHWPTRGKLQLLKPKLVVQESG